MIADLDPDQLVQLEPPSADAWVSPDLIQRNPSNPRLIFRQRELDALKQSIFEVGILQPLIVFSPEDLLDSYVLIDGERRWRCSRELNLQTIPVHIHKEPTAVQNITMMFNIHKLRVDWELMPTALSLNRLIQLTGEDRAAELSRITGLSTSMVRKCINLLSFSEKHQKMVLDHKIKDNLLLETFPVIQAIEKSLPELLEDRTKDDIVDAIIAKDQSGSLKSVTELRDLAKVVKSVNRGAPNRSIRTIVNKVLDDPSYPVSAAYSRVRALYDVKHLTSQFTRLAEEIGGFNPAGGDPKDLKKLVGSLARLQKQLAKLERKLTK